MGEYVDCWGHWVPMPDYGPQEPPQRTCPTCASDTEWDLEEIRACEWCERVGCPDCMTATIDGYACAEGECGEKLKAFEDRKDAEWPEKLKRLRGESDVAD